jgi:DNA invertase Pin-like site-specific DNA recombinase
MGAISNGPVRETNDSRTEARRVAGYLRVSTADQREFGAGLDVQRQTIRAECERRGWELVAIFEDASSGKTVSGRRGLDDALALIESGDASALVVAKLDRLSRSLQDFANLTDRSRRAGWALVALDLGLDTTSPQGELMASVLAVFSQFERRLIGQRTKEALAVKRAQGVRLGRPPALSDAVRARIREARTSGLTFAQIAATLNEERIPTAHGGNRWYASTVHGAAKAARVDGAE